MYFSHGSDYQSVSAWTKGGSEVNQTSTFADKEDKAFKRYQKLDDIPYGWHQCKLTKAMHQK